MFTHTQPALPQIYNPQKDPIIENKHRSHGFVPYNIGHHGFNEFTNTIHACFYTWKAEKGFLFSMFRVWGVAFHSRISLEG